MTPWGADPAPRRMCLVFPVTGSSRPRAPVACAVYQTNPSGEGATSWGCDPDGTRYVWNALVPGGEEVADADCVGKGNDTEGDGAVVSLFAVHEVAPTRRSMATATLLSMRFSVGVARVSGRRPRGSPPR